MLYNILTLYSGLISPADLTAEFNQYYDHMLFHLFTRARNSTVLT